MEAKNKTGWFKNDSEWFLYHKGRILGEFYITQLKPHKMMYNIGMFGKLIEEVALPSGDVNEAKSIIENEIISYCADMIAYFSGIRYTAVKAAGERVNEDA